MFPNKRLLQLAKQSRIWLVLTISLGFLSGLLTIGQARLVSQIVGQVFLKGANLSDVTRLLQIILVLFTLRAVLSWLSSLSAKTIAVQVKEFVRSTLLKHVEHLGPGFIRGEQSGEISNTMVEGVEALDSYFSQYLPQLVLSVLVPLTILLFVFPMDLLSGAVLLITAPLIPFFMYLIGTKAQEITDRQYHILSRLAGSFLDSLQGLTTLKLYNQAKTRGEQIQETSDEYRKTTMKVLQVTFLSAFVLELLATLSTAVVAVEIGLRLLYFRVSFEQALFLLMIAPEFYIPLRMLGLRFHAGMEGQSAAERIFEILDTKPLEETQVLTSPDVPLTLPMETITLGNVSFTHPGESRPILRDITLTINRGEQIALVGESGAGKTTLANLILGFFPTERGTLRINGTHLTKANLDNWREEIAWVSQDPGLFQDTIAANIRLARPDADLGAVAAAASAAHLSEFIESLPAGYDTLIGEGGTRLSGGQAQRLALARAFLKDAPILLLDEPTSQLDPVTETQLADAVQKLMKGRTVITIAHRLNTVFQADRILVLQNGEIVQEGSHSDLIKKAGVYKDLVQAYTGGLVEDFVSYSRSQIKLSSLTPSTSPLLPQGLRSESSLFSSFTKKQSIPKSPRSTLRRLLGFFKPHWPQVALSVLLGFLTIGSSIGLMGTSAWLISTAALHPSIAVMQVAIVGVRFFGILRGVSRYLERLVSHDLTFKILTRLRVWFYRSLEPLAPARLLGYRIGDLLSRIISDIKTLEDFYVRSAAPPLVALLIGVVTGVFLSGYHILLVWVLGGFFILNGLILPLIIRLLVRKPGAALVQERSQLYAQLVNIIQGLPDLLAFSALQDKVNQFKVTEGRYNQSQMRLARVSGLNAGLTILISNLAMWLVLITTIPVINAGNIPGVMLATLVLMTLSAFEAVQPLPQAMETLNSSLIAGGRLFDIVDGEPTVSDPTQPLSFPVLTKLEVKNLSFYYPGVPTPALEEINFHLRKGELLAIVGPSGGGKTTLANLLLRFWEPSEGGILVGDEKIPLNSLTGEETRGQFSVVSQNGHLFHDTIRANIALSKPDIGDIEIRNAAQIAQMDDFIQSLPNGYKTVIGERGQRLSAGEQGRLLIARAVLKDAPFFLLDEPTANLDPLTERELLNTLFEILSQKTGLLITHRLVGLSNVDQILVLAQGRIVERGTEEELLAQDGLYRTMWSLQNRILQYN